MPICHQTCHRMQGHNAEKQRLVTGRNGVVCERLARDVTRSLVNMSMSQAQVISCLENECENK